MCPYSWLTWLFSTCIQNFRIIKMTVIQHLTRAWLKTRFLSTLGSESCERRQRPSRVSKRKIGKLFWRNHRTHMNSIWIWGDRYFVLPLFYFFIKYNPWSCIWVTQAYLKFMWITQLEQHKIEWYTQLKLKAFETTRLKFKAYKINRRVESI